MCTADIFSLPPFSHGIELSQELEKLFSLSNQLYSDINENIKLIKVQSHLLSQIMLTMVSLLSEVISGKTILLLNHTSSFTIEIMKTSDSHVYKCICIMCITQSEAWTQKTSKTFSFMIIWLFFLDFCQGAAPWLMFALAPPCVQSQTMAGDGLPFCTMPLDKVALTNLFFDKLYACWQIVPCQQQ